MTSDWRRYQEDAASYFRRLGLTAVVEAKVEGARGMHVVDVYAYGTFHGVSFKWLAECKAWKTAVSKEAVLTFGGIVQDIGADRGFLFSETGFQSGALRVSNHTNVTLTNLADLVAATESSSTEGALSSVMWRINRTVHALRRVKKGYDDYEWPDELVQLLGKLAVLEHAVQDAARGEWPTVYGFDRDKRLMAQNIDELLLHAENIIGAAEHWQPSSGPTTQPSVKRRTLP